MPELYQSVLHFFMDPTHTLIQHIGLQILQVLKFQLLANALVVLAMMIWAYQRVQHADMFRWRTLFSLASFAGFFVLFNYAMQHPQAFYAWLKTTLFYASDSLMELVQGSLKASSQALGLDTQQLNLEFLINQTFHTLVWILSEITHQQSHANPSMFLTGALILSQGVLLTLILALVLIVSIEIYLWLAFGALMLPLGFFVATRSMLWLYLKKCTALSLYQPIVFLVAFYNAHVVQTLISTIPMHADNAHAPIGSSVILVVSSLLVLFLVCRVPHFIHAFFRTQGVFKDIVSMVALSKGALLQNVGRVGRVGHTSLVESSNTETQESHHWSQKPSFKIQTLSEPSIDIRQTR
ncbi:type IV secretion system protein [Helicobacter bizzozeronii]|uniref:type IV secretion system protein n=1 Tax=Helicobacter bizzozeronii TaxID=56877 RepID=UPI001F3F0520|nr:type IV secretion system protein [Helicobacter bizzozeronii]